MVSEIGTTSPIVWGLVYVQKPKTARDLLRTPYGSGCGTVFISWMATAAVPVPELVEPIRSVLGGTPSERRASGLCQKLKAYAFAVFLVFSGFAVIFADAAAFFTAARASLVSILSVGSAAICSHRAGFSRR